MKLFLGVLILCLTCASLLAITAEHTRPLILANRTAAEQAQILNLIAPYVLTEAATTWADDQWPICRDLGLVRTQVQGYAGPIEILAVVAPLTTEVATHNANDADHVSDPISDHISNHIVGNGLTKLKVSAHQETPGIGDFFERERERERQPTPAESETLGQPGVWLDQFINRSADGSLRVRNTPVDSVSGATITANALRRGLTALATRELDNPTSLSELACER